MDLSYILNSPDVERIASALESVAGGTVDALEGKVDAQQGAANAGKALVIGSDGLVTLGDAGLSEVAKEALLACFRKVAWVGTDGQDLYDALELALMGRTATSLQVAFAPGSHVVYEGDTMSSLRPYLTVTATRSSGVSEVVTDYTLDGSLVTGTQTVSVRYGGLTKSFTVTVVSSGKTFVHNWDFTRTNGLVDIVSGNVATINVNETYPDIHAEITYNGLQFNRANQGVKFGKILQPGYTFELDVASIAINSTPTAHVRILYYLDSDMLAQVNPSEAYKLQNGFLIFRYNTTPGWSTYGVNKANADVAYYNRTDIKPSIWSNWSSALNGTTSAVLNAFNGKTVKVVNSSDGHTRNLYVDDVLKGTVSNVYFDKMSNADVYIGATGVGASDTTPFAMTITGFRVYANA